MNNFPGCFYYEKNILQSNGQPWGDLNETDKEEKNVSCILPVKNIISLINNHSISILNRETINKI